VRLFVGNGGPNLVSSFHVIGEIFDYVNLEGGTTETKNVQTTLVPAGGSTIVEFKVDVPGTLILVDHSIFRTFNKGSLGMLKVEGAEDLEIYSGKTSDEVYLPEGGTIQDVSGSSPNSGTWPKPKQKEWKMENVCTKVHAWRVTNPTVCGVAGAFPPLGKV
jgi:nitrite reductase (NO-forming)